MPTSPILPSLLPSRVALPALLVLLAILPAGGCVSAARHREVQEEMERLRRENLELKRDRAELRVRVEEMLGEPAPTARTGSAAPAETPGPTASSGAGAPASGPAAGEAAAYPGAAPPGGDEIVEEVIREPGLHPGETPEGGERILWVARRYRDQGRLDEAREAYGRFIQEQPFSPLLPQAFLERGRVRLSQGDRQGALEDLRTVIEAFPASPQALEARSEAARLERP